MIREAKYIRNIDNLMNLIIAAMIDQRGKIPVENIRYELLNSFFNGENPNVYAKWHSPLDLSELNAVIINLGDVSFEARTAITENATAIYYIDFEAKGTSDSDTLDKILYVSSIICQTLKKAGKTFFSAEKTAIQKFETDPNKANDGANNVIAARLTFSIDTIEEITDFGEWDGARINDTLATTNKGTFNIYKEW